MYSQIYVIFVCSQISNPGTVKKESPTKVQTVAPVKSSYAINEQQTSLEEEVKPSSTDDSKKLSLLDILIKDKNSVTSKLSEFVSAVMSKKKSFICGIKVTALQHLQSVVGSKLHFLEHIIGPDTLQSRGGEGEEDRAMRSFNC